MKKILFVCLLLLLQVLKTNAEYKLKFLLYKDKMYYVLQSKYEICDQIIGNKIIDTVFIDDGISDILREKSYLNPNKKIVIQQFSYFFFEKAFSIFQKVDSNKYIVNHGKTINLFTVLNNKSEKKYNWFFLIPIILTIIIGFTISIKSSISDFNYFYKLRNKDIVNLIGIIIKFIFFSSLFSMFFAVIFCCRGELYHSLFPIKDFILLTIIIIFVYVISFIITIIGKNTGVKKE